MSRSVSRYGRGSVRVNLRLPADTYDLVKALADAKGTTVAGFVQESIDAMKPGYEQLTEVVGRADTVASVEEGHEVLEQLRAVAAQTRKKADELDAMITIWQKEVRDLAERGSGDKTS